MKQNKQLVMLPNLREVTYPHLVMQDNTKKLLIAINSSHGANHTPQELYLVSDEEIKELP